MRKMMLAAVAAGCAPVALAHAASVTGMVTSPDGQAFRGAFVQAENQQTKILVSVLSDNQGRYRIPNLPAGDYRIQLRAPGFAADAKTNVMLTADDKRQCRIPLAQGHGPLE